MDVVHRLRADGDEVEYLGAVGAGLAEGLDRRSRREKITDDLRDGGVGAVGERLVTALRARVQETPGRFRDRVRNRVEREAMQRFGLRPSDRMVFDRMLATSRDAGLRYQPPTVDAPVELYLGSDGGERWVTAMSEAWRDVAGQGLRVEIIPGSHHEGTMLTDPNVAVLASLVTSRLGLDEHPGTAT